MNVVVVVFLPLAEEAGELSELDVVELGSMSFCSNDEVVELLARLLFGDDLGPAEPLEEGLDELICLVKRLDAARVDVVSSANNRRETDEEARRSFTR